MLRAPSSKSWALAVSRLWILTLPADLSASSRLCCLSFCLALPTQVGALVLTLHRKGHSVSKHSICRLTMADKASGKIASLQVQISWLRLLQCRKNLQCHISQPFAAPSLNRMRGSAGELFIRALVRRNALRVADEAKPPRSRLLQDSTLQSNQSLSSQRTSMPPVASTGAAPQAMLSNSPLQAAFSVMLPQDLPLQQRSRGRQAQRQSPS